MAYSIYTKEQCLRDLKRELQELCRNDKNWNTFYEEQNHHAEEYNRLSKERDEAKRASPQDKRLVEILGTKRRLANSRRDVAYYQRGQRQYELERQLIQSDGERAMVEADIKWYQGKVHDREKEVNKYLQELNRLESEKEKDEPFKPPKEFTFPELCPEVGYRYAAKTSLGLVQLPKFNNHLQSVSIEAVSDMDPKVLPTLNSNEILITPIVRLCPQELSFDLSKPAIVELIKSVVPTDANPNRQLVPIYSCSNPVQWKELASHNCEMLKDRIRFRTTQFGYVSVMARFPFPSASVTIDPKLQQQEQLEIKELPGFKVEIPPVSVPSTTKISATVVYDNPQVTEHYNKDRSLASACVKLEPHNIQFHDKVKISIPIPNYSEMRQKYPNTQLEVWHSNSTNEGVPISWESLPFTIHFDERGNCLATVYVTHFSDVLPWWKGLLGGCLNFFASTVHGRCQVFMSSEKRWESLLTFGVAVLLYPYNEPYRVIPNHPNILFDSVVPVEIMAGDIECQIDLNDIILSKFPAVRHKKLSERCSFSRDCSIRADFNVELNVKNVSAELPAGISIATLLIKHGSTEAKCHKFNLIKPVESSVDPNISLKGIPSTSPHSICETHSIQLSSHPITKAAHKLTKTTKQLKQNVLVLSAGRMAKHMEKVAEIACGLGVGNIVDTMLLIVRESEEIEATSRQVAEACTEQGLKKNLIDVVGRIPGIAHQLRLLSKKMDRGHYISSDETSQEATDLLTTNATNLMSTVETVLCATERAIIKVPQLEMDRLNLVSEDAAQDILSQSIQINFSAELAKSTRKLSDDDLATVHSAVWDARSKWYVLGSVLSIKIGDLEAIKEENHQDCGKCLREVLLKWLRRSNPIPTWQSLVTALKNPTVEVQVNLEH